MFSLRLSARFLLKLREKEKRRNLSSVHIPSQHVANISFTLFFTHSVRSAGEVAMEASSSYCGVGIHSGARIGGEENNKASSRWWEEVHCGWAAVASSDMVDERVAQCEDEATEM